MNTSSYESQSGRHAFENGCMISFTLSGENAYSYSAESLSVIVIKSIAFALRSIRLRPSPPWFDANVFTHLS
jgi:hypothetical protein